MNVEILSEHSLRLAALHEAGVTASAGPDPVQLLACALGQCTYAVLAGYAQRLQVDAHTISMTVSWRLTERPHRVARLDLDVQWPTLPASRLDAATRAARHCTVHNTLTQTVEVEVLVDH